MTNLAAYLDYANHHASATADDIKKLCAGVLAHGFHAAFVNATYIALAKETLGGKAKVGSVISFPLGQDTLLIKVAACLDAIKLGADELDLVPNLGLFLQNKEAEFLEEMTTIVSAVRHQDKDTIVKFIMETGYLDNLPQRVLRVKKAAQLIKQSGADFVKICSGMGPRGASVEDIKLVREAVGPETKIKAAGGIDTYQEALALIAAGAVRIGTSQAPKILEEAKQATV